MMLEKSGVEFEPRLLRIFANMVGIYPIGSLVALDTGEIGIVTETHPDTAFLLRPKVKLITDNSGNKLFGETVGLTEKIPGTRDYKRSIVKPLDPHLYNVQVADYILAEAFEGEQPVAGA
jgi:hypothetical protein